MPGLKNVRTLTIAALLVALGILVGFFKIPISDILEIRFTALPLAVAGAFLGPGIAAVIGALSDIGGFIIMPTGPYFPGFTVSGAVSGIIYGLLLYQKDIAKISIKRIFIAVVINAVIVNMVLNSLWLNIMYGKGGFIAIISARVVKELVMIPVNTILITAVLKPISQFAYRHILSQEGME